MGECDVVLKTWLGEIELIVLLLIRAFSMGRDEDGKKGLFVWLR